MLLMILVLEL